jgi:DNA (cytosine-5)-methyltransferase 1
VRSMDGFRQDSNAAQPAFNNALETRPDRAPANLGGAGPVVVQGPIKLPPMTSVQHESPASTARMVDLFAGPGGLDVAARWLQVPAVGIEWDENACATRRRAGLETLQGDVRDHGPQEFPRATILTGGPPCQTFTLAGSGGGRRALDQVLGFMARMAEEEDVATDLAALDDERTGLVLEPLRWALDAHRLGRPYETIVLEQVPAVLPVWRAMEEVLKGIGYKTTSEILHAEEYGVPQTRRRAILMAARDRTPRMPEATHRRYRKLPITSEIQSSRLPCETMGAFFVVSNYGSGGDPKARGRRTFNEPAFTVTGKVSRNRVWSDDGVELDRFSQSEAGRLQTFPLDYPWSGNDVSQQIGNAIPPRLAAHVLAAALGVELSPGFFDQMMKQSWANIKDREINFVQTAEPDSAESAPTSLGHGELVASQS